MQRKGKVSNLDFHPLSMFGEKRFQGAVNLFCHPCFATCWLCRLFLSQFSLFFTSTIIIKFSSASIYSLIFSSSSPFIWISMWFLCWIWQAIKQASDWRREKMYYLLDWFLLPLDSFAIFLQLDLSMVLCCAKSFKITTEMILSTLTPCSLSRLSASREVRMLWILSWVPQWRSFARNLKIACPHKCKLWREAMKPKLCPIENMYTLQRLLIEELRTEQWYLLRKWSTFDAC